MDLIESIFKLKDHKTSFKKEILAGLATFPFLLQQFLLLLLLAF